MPDDQSEANHPAIDPLNRKCSAQPRQLFRHAFHRGSIVLLGLLPELRRNAYLVTVERFAPDIALNTSLRAIRPLSPSFRPSFVLTRDIVAGLGPDTDVIARARFTPDKTRYASAFRWLTGGLGGLEGLLAGADRLPPAG